MGKLDNYSWRPLLWATLLAITLVGWMGALNFMPIRPPLAGGFGVRLTLDLWFPFVALAVLGFGAVLAIGACVALIRRRFRRALSLAWAAATIPLLVGSHHYVGIFSPYYWYVMENHARFEAEARSLSTAKTPVFAILETRDVSIGLVTTPPSYVSVVYDESDEIGLDPESRSPEWKVRNDEIVGRHVGGYVASWRWTQHLRGHFFLLGAG